MKLTQVLSLTLSLTLAAGASADRLATKQLSGPIDEIRTGVMAPVAPAEAGINSKSAMIPVEMFQTKNGDWRWNGTIAVDNDRFNMVLFSGDETWNVELGHVATKSLTAAHRFATKIERSEMGLGGNQFEGDYYGFEEVQPGEWNLSLKAENARSGKGYLLYSSESPYRLMSYQANRAQLVGSELGFVAYGYQRALTDDDDSPKVNAGVVEKAMLRITAPDGSETLQAMFDDGLHGDEAAGDGVFGGSFVPATAGDYLVQTVAHGTTLEGAPFTRTAEHLVPVLVRGIELADDVASARIVDDKRLEVSLKVNNSFKAPAKYRVFAEVWGLDAVGEMQPVNWIGGMVYVEDGRLNLGLDARWIALSAAESDFELRNVRIEDPDSFVPVLKIENMAMSTPSLPKAAWIAPKSIDEEMLMGPRPTAPIAKAAGGKLMLVHGYCSGDAWGSSQGQFANSIKFQDFDKNRSHDQFATLIANFGASYPSFGVVAHSQGGAASLHLYTYYWSGLDNADPGRLIQSVGTPYQGTSLAGNIAALGSIFGAGCGANNDLTYSGASSWLSGIPNWARGEVNYYTTSFTDKWWRYDYCHLASDLILGDPDDGTTEKSKGQLSGAVNRGHKTGWCHTSGMRDPRQVTDSGRNSTMSSNAAR